MNRKLILAVWCHAVNFGDLLTPFLIEKLFDLEILPLYKTFTTSSKIPHAFLIGCGSILNRTWLHNGYIWGSGFIAPPKKVIGIPSKIYAVRGPKTRKILLSADIQCPEKYCDSAYLLSRIYKNKEEKKYKLGIIPHYVDKKHPIITKNWGEEVKIIDIQGTISQVVKEVKQCENIAASSLHGVIVADTFGIPRVPIKITNNVIGGDFKFLDYGESINLPIRRLVMNNETAIKELLKACKLAEVPLKERTDYLMQSLDDLIITDIEKIITMLFAKNSFRSLKKYMK